MTIDEHFYAPLAKFELIYQLSPIKVASVFLTSLHCLFLLIAFLTSFWIETKTGFYGPIFRCELFNPIPSSINSGECQFGGFTNDYHLFSISSIVLLIVCSLILAISSIIVATFSFYQSNDSIRHRFWFSTIILQFFVLFFDICVLILIPLNYRNESFDYQWAYGVFCGATLFSFVSLIMSVFSHEKDDSQYIETIDQLPMS